MIALPPLEVGSFQVTTALAFPAVAFTPVGASGRVIGVTAAEASEAVEVPATFVAVTVNVYAVPLVRPLIVALVPVLLTVAPPGLAVRV